MSGVCKRACCTGGYRTPPRGGWLQQPGVLLTIGVLAAAAAALVAWRW